MTDDKKKPEDETPKAQAEDAKPSEDLSDEELEKAAGGIGNDVPPRSVPFSFYAVNPDINDD